MQKYSLLGNLIKIYRCLFDLFLGAWDKTYFCCLS